MEIESGNKRKTVIKIMKMVRPSGLNRLSNNGCISLLQEKKPEANGLLQTLYSHGYGDKNNHSVNTKQRTPPRHKSIQRQLHRKAGEVSQGIQLKVKVVSGDSAYASEETYEIVRRELRATPALKPAA